jgi:hypothetical protein
MPMMLVAMLLLAQAPSTAPATQSTQPITVTQEKKKKPKQICQNFMVTGSLRPQRVCRDENGIFRLGPEVANEAPNSGMLHPPPPAPQPTSFGGPPK